MAGHTALIVGAGFSRPFGGLLLRELLSPEVVGMSRASPEALAAVAALARHPDRGGWPSTVEGTFTRIWEDQFSSRTFNVGGKSWEARELLRELRLHLGSVTAAIRLDRRNALAKQLEAFVAGIADASKTLTIVSFNYDTLLEQCLESQELVYSYGPRSLVTFVDKSKERELDRFEPDVEILKLHGSVNWGICRECAEAPVASDLINAFPWPYVPPRNVSCQFCDKPYLLPSIVPPVLTKGLALQSFELLWRTARKRLARAREIIVVGYSMPDADRQAISLLSEIDGPLKRPRIRIVCGESGAPASYGRVFKRFDDTALSFENFLGENT